MRRLREIAATLGADVPYFLEGGTALGLDRGDLLYPLVDHPAAWVTLVVPAFGVSTAEAFGWWDEIVGRRRPARHQPAPLTSGESLDPPPDLCNDLQGPLPRITRRSRGSSARCRRQAPSMLRCPAAGRPFSGCSPAARTPRAPRGRFRNAGGPGRRRPRHILVTKTVNRAAYQRLAGIPAHRINLPFAPRSLGHS